MKILRGDLTETRYEFPNGDKEQPMQVKSEQVHKENAVAYMADELGLHRVSNQGSDFAVSLHRRSLKCMYIVPYHLANVDSIHSSQRSKERVLHLQPQDRGEDARNMWSLLVAWQQSSGLVDL